MAKVRSGELAAVRYGYGKGEKAWEEFPGWMRSFLHFLYAFLHALLIGAITGATLGLVPLSHNAFFGDPENGDIFTAWLTDSVKNIVIVGAKLGSSLREMKRGRTEAWTPLVLSRLCALLFSYISSPPALTSWMTIPFCGLR